MTREGAYWDSEHETMAMPELRAYQFRRLKPLLEWTYARSSFYRERFDAAGVQPSDIASIGDFVDRVPFISKELIIEAQCEKPPFGGFLTVPTADLTRVYVAPGPIHTPLTVEDLDGCTEAAALGIWAAGIRPADIVDMTAMYDWVIAGTLLDEAYRKVGCAVVPGGVGNTKMHIEVMRTLRVSSVWAFSTFLVHIAETAREMGLDLRKDLALRSAVISGELKPKEAIAELEDMYGMKVREAYAGADIGWVATECDARAGMHLGPYQIVEILDPVTHRPVPEGDGGEIVATVLFRKAMPLIRYRTGDIVGHVQYNTCACGRRTPRLGPIVGRVGNIPRIKGMFVVPKQIENALYSFKGLGRFEMTIDRPRLADELTIRIEAAPEVDRAASKMPVQQAVRDAIRIGAEVEFVDPGTLSPDTVVIDKRRL